jgi:Flp pilus assembly protein TadG
MSIFRFMQRKRGQSLVELALVLPLFLLVFLGIVDFGITLHVWSALNEQCVQAARVGTKRLNQLVARNVFSSTTHAPLADVQAAFHKYRSPLMATENYQNIAYTGVGETGAQEVRVSAEYKISFYTPFLGTMFGGPGGDGKVTIQAMARERKE